MNDIPPIKTASAVNGIAPQKPVEPARQPATDAGEDRVEISEAGQLLSSLEHDAGIRAEKVARIRDEILNGTYETDDKVEVTVERLLDVLRGLGSA
jgi:anti-sigma28 factor (negative regulator of flagellin synthesis)